MSGKRFASPRRIALATAIEIAVVVTLYVLLADALVGGQTVATLLSQGAGATPSDLLLAGAFVLLRFVVVLMLPAFAAYRLVRWALAKVEQGRAPAEDRTEL